MNNDITGSRKRMKQFSRVSDLENILAELNENLRSANQIYLDDSSEKYSKIFIMGALRSGTTLFTQWLANTSLVAYPTNMLSRFYGAPLVGGRIQQLLTDPRYNFRNEILDFNSDVNFSSENGKTKGALAPNEFWYFWRRFLPFNELDYMPAGELQKEADLTGFRDELNALSNIFEKPFAMKGMIMNQNISELAEQFEKSIFIWVKRDPVFNIQSALEARKRQYGDMNIWYSFKIREYNELKILDPLESVAGQIAAINCSIEKSFTRLDESQKIIVDYESFCQAPSGYYEKLQNMLMLQSGENIELKPYHGKRAFRSTNTWRLEEYCYNEVKVAYQRYYEKYSALYQLNY